jgi:hypothetical protein
MHVQVRYMLTPVEAGTALTLAYEVEGHGLFKLIEVLMGRRLGHTLPSAGRTLKRNLESR